MNPYVPRPRPPMGTLGYGAAPGPAALPPRPVLGVQPGLPARPAPPPPAPVGQTMQRAPVRQAPPPPPRPVAAPLARPGLGAAMPPAARVPAGYADADMGPHDTDLIEPGGGSHWTLREEPTFLLAKNQRTGQIGKVRVDPLTPHEHAQAMAPHGAGPLDASAPNRIHTTANDLFGGPAFTSAAPGQTAGNDPTAQTRFGQNSPIPGVSQPMPDPNSAPGDSSNFPGGTIGGQPAAAFGGTPWAANAYTGYYQGEGRYEQAQNTAQGAANAAYLEGLGNAAMTGNKGYAQQYGQLGANLGAQGAAFAQQQGRQGQGFGGVQSGMYNTVAGNDAAGYGALGSQFGAQAGNLGASANSTFSGLGQSAAGAYGGQQANYSGLQREGNAVGQTGASQYMGAQGAQANSLGLMQSAAEGNAPSAAELTMQKGTEDSIRAQMAMANSTRGGFGLANAQKNAQQAGMAMEQGNAQQAGVLRAQEMATARDQYAQAALAQGAQGISQEGMGQNAELAAAAGQLNATQGMTGAQLAAAQSGQQGMLSAAQLGQAGQLGAMQGGTQSQLAAMGLGSQYGLAGLQYGQQGQEFGMNYGAQGELAGLQGATGAYNTGVNTQLGAAEAGLNSRQGYDTLSAQTGLGYQNLGFETQQQQEAAQIANENAGAGLAVANQQFAGQVAGATVGAIGTGLAAAVADLDLGSSGRADKAPGQPLRALHPDTLNMLRTRGILPARSAVVYSDAPVAPDPSQFNATLSAAGLQAPPQPGPGMAPPQQIGVPANAVPMAPMKPFGSPLDVAPPTAQGPAAPRPFGPPPADVLEQSRLQKRAAGGGADKFGAPPADVVEEHRKQEKEREGKEKAEGAIFAKPGEGGGGLSGMKPTIVPAHAVSTVSPKTRELEEKGLAEERRGAEEGLTAEVGAKEQEADLLKAQSIDATIQQSEERTRARDLRAKIGAHYDEMAKLDREAGEGKIIADRRSTGQRIAGAIAQAFGAFGASMTHSQNGASAIIDKFLERDVEEQKANLATKRADIEGKKNILREKMALLGNPLAAEEAARAHSARSMALLAQSNAAAAQVPSIKAKWNAVAGLADQKAAEANAKMEHWMQTTAVGGTGGISEKEQGRIFKDPMSGRSYVARTEEGRKKLTDSAAATRQIQELAQQYAQQAQGLDILDKFGHKIGINSEAMARATTTYNEITSIARKQQHDGVWKPSESELIANTLAPPDKIVGNQAAAQAAEIAKHAADAHQNTMDAEDVLPVREGWGYNAKGQLEPRAAYTGERYSPPPREGQGYTKRSIGGD